MNYNILLYNITVYIKFQKILYCKFIHEKKYSKYNNNKNISN